MGILMKLVNFWMSRGIPKKSKLVFDDKLNCVVCNDCKNISFPSKDYCDRCQSLNVSQLLLGSKWKLMSYTISYIQPVIGYIKVPYPYGVARFFNEDGGFIDVLGVIDSKKPFNDIEINKDVQLLRSRVFVKFKMVGNEK